MKRCLRSRWVSVASVAILLIFVALALADKKRELDREKCTFGDIKLYGKMQFVASGGDIKIKAVCTFPDLKVKMVSVFADRCGEWQVVDSFPDFTVQFVESFPDLKVEFVNSFPGVP